MVANITQGLVNLKENETMIAGGFGSCSTLVHVIAQHPKVAMMIGVVGTVVYLSGGAGPGYRNGNEKSRCSLSRH